MADLQLHENYSQDVRDQQGSLLRAIENKPMFMSLVSVSDLRATNTTHNWTEDTFSVLATDITAAYTAGAGSITVASTVGFKVGSILKFIKLDTTTSTLEAKVTNVVSGTSLDISVYGGSVDENLAVGAQVVLKYNLVDEASDAQADYQYDWTNAFNYTQIFSRTASISKTSDNSRFYGLEKAMDRNIALHLDSIAREMNESIISGRRVQRVEGSESGSMGGVLSYLDLASNTVDAGAAAISESILNDAILEAVKKGGNGMNVILGHPDQITKISSFVSSYRDLGINPNGAPAVTAGTYVDRFRSNTGMLFRLVWDTAMPVNQIAILDMSKLALVPYQDDILRDEDATDPGSRLIKRRLHGQYTLRFANAANAHIKINNVGL